MRRLKIILGTLLTLLLNHNALAQNAAVVAPQGRLTLTSNVAVMRQDVINATTVYYVPYVGNQISIYNPSGSPSTWLTLTFSQLSLTLNTSQTMGQIYDIFAFSNAGTVQIGYGPPWTNLTTRGAGTAVDANGLNGLLLNNNEITLYNGSYTYSDIDAGAATYLGSIYMTGNGETSIQFKPTPAAGGTNNVIGIWNAYNRVPAHSLNRDSTASWTQTNASGWQVADPGSSSANRITWLDGWQQTSVASRFTVLPAPSSSTLAAAVIGINLDSTSATPDLTADTVYGGNTTFSQSDVEETFTPQLGLNYVQAMEYVNFTGTIIYYGAPSFAYEGLNLDFDY